MTQRRAREKRTLRDQQGERGQELGNYTESRLSPLTERVPPGSSQGESRLSSGLRQS